MPYRFPRKLARTTDVPHPREFNQAWQPLAELASGNLDAHNFDSGLTAIAVEAGPHTFYKPYYIEVASNPGWGNPTAYTAPTIAGLPSSAHFVGQTANWSPVASMELTVTTGVSNLWIVFWGAYVLHEFIATAVVPWHEAETRDSFLGVARAAGLQFALEVDGSILSETITGFNEDWHKEFAATKAVYQRNPEAASATSSDPGANFPGPIIRQSNYIQGIGPAAGAVRIICNASVSPGTHNIRVVARTLQSYLPRRSDGPNEDKVGLAVHNRKLFVLDCPVYPASAPTRTAVDVPPVTDGMVLTTAELNTNRHLPLVNHLNDIEAGDVARGAFVNGHLPSVIEDKSTVALTPTATQNMHCLYPGFGVNTFAGTKATGATGWWWLNDGATTPRLRTDSDAFRPGAWDVSGGNKYFIILGNVQLHSIIGSTAARSSGHLGAFALGYKITGGGTEEVESTEGYVNNHIDSWYFGLGDSNKDRFVEVDVPLFHVLNYSTANGGAAPAFNSIDYFGILASSFGLTVVTEGPDLNYQRGNISVLELRG